MSTCRCLDPWFLDVLAFGIFQNQVSWYMYVARRDVVCILTTSRPRFHHRGERSRKDPRRARLKQEGSSRRRAGARISRWDLRCTRVMICERPDRDPVRLAWLAGGAERAPTLSRNHPPRGVRGVRREEGRPLRSPNGREREREKEINRPRLCRGCNGRTNLWNLNSVPATFCREARRGELVPRRSEGEIKKRAR